MRINEIVHEYKNDFRLYISNLDIPNNKIIGLVGENGSGKTTFMSILSGYLKANMACNIYNDDMGKVLFIPSDMELYDFLTVNELLRLVKKYTSDDFDEFDILNMLDLSEKRDCMIDELSLGMRKKLTLLPLFISTYDLVILDEPFNSIDMGYIYKLKELIAQKKNKTTFLISSHILETLTDICDEFILLSKGTIVKTFENSGDLRSIEGEIFERRY